MKTEIVNFVQVSPELASSGVIPRECFGELGKGGYEVVINLLPADSPYAVAGERDAIEAMGIEYVHIPVEMKAPTRERFERFVAAMDAAAGKRIWTHCAANWRVSAFVSLYGERRWGWSGERADAHIARLWQPDEVWTAFIAAIRASREEDG